MGLGGVWWSNVPDSAHPCQRLRPNTQMEHQVPASHVVQRKRRKEKKRTDNILGQMVKASLYRKKSHKGAYSYTLTKKEKNEKNI